MEIPCHDSKITKTNQTSENAWPMAVNIPTDPNLCQDEDPPCLFPFIVDDSTFNVAKLDCGNLSKGTFEVEGYEERLCTMKIFYQTFFNDFRREIDVYQALAGEQYVLQFYAAFAGFSVDEPFGVILMELFDEQFESFDEMDLAQK